MEEKPSSMPWSMGPWILNSPLLAVTAWALQVRSMYLSRRNAMKIQFILETTCKTESALVDSGATENFIDPRTVA